MRMMLMLAFGLAVIMAVVFGLAWLANAAATRRRPLASDDPKAILRRRYAAGEIDEDEYLRRMSGLSQEW